MLPILADTTATVSSTLSDGFAGIKDDLLDTIITVLPYALAVVGAILAITVGYKLFKKFSH